MLPIIRKLRIILKACGCTLAAWLLLQIFAIFDSFQPMQALLDTNDLFFYKRFFKNRGANAYLNPDSAIVIIDSVDPAERLGRSEYAEILETLRLGGAACVGIDISFFDERDRQNDLALVKAVAQFPRVILPINFAVSKEHGTSSIFAVDHIQKLALSAAEAKAFRLKPPLSEAVEVPFDSLLFTAKHVGHINFLRDRYHVLPLVFKHDRHFYPVMPFEVTRVYREYKKEPPLKITEIPTTYNYQMFVNFVPADRFSYYKLKDALKLLKADFAKLDSARFKDKIVLLVNSSPEIPLVDTPLGYVPYPRWALHASLINQLLQARPIKSPIVLPLVFVWVTLVLFLVWSLFLAERLAERWRRVRWMFIIGNAIFVALAYFGMHAELWLGVTTPVIVYSAGLMAIRNDIYRIYQIPQYEDFSISVTEFHGDSYPVSIMHSPAGEELEKISFAKFFARKPVIDAEGKLVNLTAGLNDTRQLGKQLYEAIFQKSIETRLMQSLGLVDKDHKNLRIRLRLDSPEISRLPWEYMYSDGLPVGFVALNRNVSLARYIPFTAPREPAVYRPPLKILVAIASPMNLMPLDVEAEKKSIETCLRNLIRLRQVKLSFCEHATLEKLSNEISSGNHHVLHYIGHSTFDEIKNEGALLLENDAGEAQEVEAMTIGGVLGESSIRLAILNSCEGAASSNANTFLGVAQALVKVGVPAVVAMQHTIRDDTAILFSKTFYSAFLVHFSVDAAVTETRRAIMKRVGLNRQDWGTPVLFMRADGAKIFGLK